MHLMNFHLIVSSFLSLPPFLSLSLSLSVSLSLSLSRVKEQDLSWKSPKQIWNCSSRSRRRCQARHQFALIHFFAFRSPLLIVLIDAIKYRKLIRYDMRTFCLKCERHSCFEWDPFQHSFFLLSEWPLKFRIGGIVWIKVVKTLGNTQRAFLRTRIMQARNALLWRRKDENVVGIWCLILIDAQLYFIQCVEILRNLWISMQKTI